MSKKHLLINMGKSLACVVRWACTSGAAANVRIAVKPEIRGMSGESTASAVTGAARQGAPRISGLPAVAVHAARPARNGEARKRSAHSVVNVLRR